MRVRINCNELHTVIFINKDFIVLCIAYQLLAIDLCIL